MPAGWGWAGDAEPFVERKRRRSPAANAIALAIEIEPVKWGMRSELVKKIVEIYGCSPTTARKAITLARSGEVVVPVRQPSTNRRYKINNLESARVSGEIIRLEYGSKPTPRALMDKYGCTKSTAQRCANTLRGVA